jgi:hypothetical protein
MGWVESNIRARQRERYMRAIEGQGFAFIELRTPPDDLSLGDRPRGLRYPDGEPVDDADRLLLLPPVQLFGPCVRLGTAEVLAGTKDGWGPWDP